MKKLFLAALMLFSFGESRAQNSPAWDTLVNDPSKFVIFKVEKAPELPDLAKFTRAYTWESVLQVGLGCFYDAPKLWYDSTQYHKEPYMLAQALVGTHYQARNLRWEVGVTYPKAHSNYKAFYAAIIKPAFSNAVYREALYDWIVPHLKTVLKKLPAAAQENYRIVLRQAIAYLKIDFYKKELAFYKKSNAGFVFGQDDKNKDKAYNDCPRDISAFCFRRIHNGEMTREQILGYAERLLKDFE